jgi:hypothetical protein
VPCGMSSSPFRASTTPILPSLHLQWNLLPVSTSMPLQALLSCAAYTVKLCYILVRCAVLAIPQ